MRKTNLAKLIEYLLYLFVFLLPWQTRWIVFNSLINGETLQFGGQVWEYGRISVYAFDIVFVIAILLYCYIVLFCHPDRSEYSDEAKRSQNTNGVEGSVKEIVSAIHINLVCRFPHSLSQLVPKGARRDSLGRNDKKGVFLFFCFLVFLFLSILWADNKLISFYWSLRILQGILLIWLLSKINFSKIKLAWAFVISMTLSAGLAIYQFLTQSTFASKWLGLAYHSARVLGDSVIEFADQRWLRAYGSFPHPNILAGFLVLAIVLCFWLFSKTQDSINNKQEKKNFLLLYYPIILLLITALFFTFSRAAWIALIVLSIWYLVFSIKKYKLLNCYIVKLLVVSCLLLVILSIIFWPLVKTRVAVEERLEIKSNIERVEGTQQSFEIIKNNLWLGVGIGNYTNELQKINPDLQAWDYQPVHNIYLLVMSEVGLIGVLLIVILLYCLLKEIRNWKLESRNLIFIFIFLYYFIFMFFFDHFWWTLASGMLIVFLTVGLINKKPLV